MNHRIWVASVCLMSFNFGCSKEDAPPKVPVAKPEKVPEPVADSRATPKAADVKVTSGGEPKGDDTPAVKEPEKPVSWIDEETPAVVRYWKMRNGEGSFSGELVASSPKQLKLRLRHYKRKDEVRTFDIADLSQHDLDWLKHWKEPSKRTALRKFGSDVHCRPDGTIHLNLSQSGSTDDDLKLASALPETSSINLFECPVTDAGLPALASLPRLRELAIVETHVRGSGLRHLIASKTLESLVFAPENLGDSIAEHIHHLRELKQLKKLTLRFCVIGTGGAKSIAELSNLESLGLISCRIDFPVLGDLAVLKKLRKLDLSGNRIPDADMMHLASFRELRELDLSHMELSVAALGHVGKLSRLERLVLPSVADDGLAAIASLAELKELRLRGAPITDLGLKHLASLTKLVELDLRYTKTTETGIAELKKRLPTTKILTVD